MNSHAWVIALLSSCARAAYAAARRAGAMCSLTPICEKMSLVLITNKSIASFV
ncbi:hypothetical protein CULCOIPH003_15350 [Corynebacterium ulcerans]|nr:hypothetical protein CULCOIPH001_04310 [Corynebacterium ulcerans]GJJ38904.1 hypothetical protein CULCOIPH003_15350 [Corynebacterium ulcerans]GJJ39949.1 hypothetical protein CULCOIPH004_03600 [Corynebacterium ulcerans]